MCIRKLRNDWAGEDVFVIIQCKVELQATLSKREKKKILNKNQQNKTKKIQLQKEYLIIKDLTSVVIQEALSEMRKICS